MENWKAYLKNPIQNVKYRTTVNTLTTSSIYSSLLKTIFVRPTAENNILRHGFTESTIQKVYLMPFSVTNEVKIMFQFKVIPNVLPIRATLYPDGISESPICNLCNAWFHLHSERDVLHVRRLCSIRLPNFLVPKDGRNNVAFCTVKIRFRTPVKQVVFSYWSRIKTHKVLHGNNQNALSLLPPKRFRSGRSRDKSQRERGCSYNGPRHYFYTDWPCPCTHIFRMGVSLQ